MERPFFLIFVKYFYSLLTLLAFFFASLVFNMVVFTSYNFNVDILCFF